MRHTALAAPRGSGIPKLLTGVAGLDALSQGGIPQGRTTVVLGGPGSGKTIFGLQFLATRARDFGEAGLFVTFEETRNSLEQNIRSLGWGGDLLQGSRDRPKIELFDARLPPEVVHTGDFDLNGFIAILGAKLDEIGARIVVLDAVDALLLALNDRIAEQNELVRIHEWVRSRALTCIISAKSADTMAPSPPWYAFLEYLTDCVIQLRHDITNRVSTRSLRLTKYRGSQHSSNECPMILDGRGISIYCSAPKELDYSVSTERVPSGVPRLDTMLGGGYIRGAGILVSGAPGTAKSTLAGALADATCRSAERALFVSFDEAASQITRNLRSVGIDLEQHVAAGSLRMASYRAGSISPEIQMMLLRDLMDEHEPRTLIIDPISGVTKTGNLERGAEIVVDLLDTAKTRGITVLLTALLDPARSEEEATQLHISTIADTWIHVSFRVQRGERNRALTIIKSRGTRHSNQVRELILSTDGISLTDVFVAGGEVLLGTARLEKEDDERRREEQRLADHNQRRREIEEAEAKTAAQIRALEAELTRQQAELDALRQEERTRVHHRDQLLANVRRFRHADVTEQDGGRPRAPQTD